ncbi:NAD(P)-binding protein [Schizopora paradoxa]|uniref:NAD(P)-binding protein n=1 Tax=Schizopora paradoxa TaxID=27342 RepID=A0A0H2RKD2_9AGAM|nr:NAD(P)-binding protein [Schizopora paradoxa]
MRKTAVVTGSAQGIGRSIALRLAADGMNVTLNDLPSNQQKLKELALEITDAHSSKDPIDRPGVLVSVGDVSVSTEVQNMVKETVSAFGSLDVMVANAGIMLMGQLHDVNESDWDKVISVNLRGTMLCFKYAAQQMISQGKGGCLLAASSVGGRKGYFACSAYCASKFAIRGLVQSSALELGKHEIRVNAYAPGFIDTDMGRGAADYLKIDFHKTAGATPLGRSGNATDISNVVSFLASPDASFVTGQTYGVCGGTLLD